MAVRGCLILTLKKIVKSQTVMSKQKLRVNPRTVTRLKIWKKCCGIVLGQREQERCKRAKAKLEVGTLYHAEKMGGRACSLKL